MAKRRVLVLGGGGAGLAAALQAAESGATVTVLERESKPGGNTSISGGLMRGSETFLQRNLGIEDTWVRDFDEQWTSSGGRCDPMLVARLARNSGSAFDWLHDRGVVFKEDAMAIPPRTAMMLPAGGTLTDALQRAVAERGVEVRYGARAQKFLTESSGVVGCQVRHASGETETLRGFDAFVLATGGAWGPRDLLRSVSSYADVISTWGNPTGGKGDGWDLVRSANGALINLDEMVVNASIFLDEALNYVGNSTSALRFAGGALFLSQDLKRFVDEKENEPYLGRDVARFLKSSDRSWIWEIWDGTALQKVPKAKLYASELAGRGLLQADSLDALAALMKVDGGQLRQSIAKYNADFAQGRMSDSEFDKSLQGQVPLDSPPYFAIRLGLSASHSKGGARIDPQARVLDQRGLAIANLYAAGDDASGFFGEGYLPGINLLQLVVYGRIAGENAATGTAGAAERQAGPSVARGLV